MHARPDRVVHDQNQSPGPNRSRIRIWTWHFQWFLCQKPVDWLGRAMQTMDPVELKGNHKASALGDQYPSKFGQDWTELYHTCSQSGCTSYHMSHSIRLQYVDWCRLDYSESHSDAAIITSHWIWQYYHRLVWNASISTNYIMWCLHLLLEL